MTLEEGGFDVCWPSALPDGPAATEAMPGFAGLVAEVVGQKGWCLIQTIVDDITREEAVAQALALPHSASLKAEMLVDYLGRGGRGKISILDYQGVGGFMPDDDEHPWALAEYDAELTNLAKALAPRTEAYMGFRSSGRRKGMVWAPFSEGAGLEELDRLSEVISEEDIDAGVIEAHIKFLRQRKLCMVNLVDNKGGELILHPREDIFPGSAPVSLPLTPNKLLVFRCDWMSYSYKPLGDNAVSVTTWIVDSSATVPDLNLCFLDVGDIQQKSEMLGIMVGPPMPTGYRMHAMQMHCRIPGGVYDVQTIQSLFSAGVDAFERIPMLRFDVELYCTMPDEDKDPFRSYVIHASMLSHPETCLFDNEFFSIPEEEAGHLAPSQRVILQDGYATLRMAGFNRETLRGRKMSTFIGDTGTDWNPFWMLRSPVGGPQQPWTGKQFGNLEASPFHTRGVASHVTSARLSHCWGMVGNSIAIDTACSASLVGVATAVQGMRRTDANQGKAISSPHVEDSLCMGINTLMSPFTFIGLCGPSMLSKKGRCFTFDYSASGYARGDGFGAMYITAGESDESFASQMACFMGVRVNQDGRSATLTAPNGVAQQACIRESMREAGVVASQITIAECHGTGTALGDPIEVGALRGVMEPRETPLLTTSAKSNIGHQEACAGMIGVIKCCLMVMTSNCSPNLHLRLLNPHLDTDGFPAFFDSEMSDTQLNSNYAGVSSFGFSGTNARADVWSQCKAGPRKASKVDLEKVDQIHVRCPVSMGLIEHLTGEPITRTFRDKKKYKADVLRDEFAPYDVSSYAYEGGFRFRREPLLDMTDEDLDPEIGMYVCGSWNGWTRKERMGRQGGGWYVCTVPLGEGRYELFNICVNEDPTMAIYPSINNAGPHIWIEGPSSSGESRNWLIDGRDFELPAGTLFEVRFRWHSEKMTIRWEQVSSSLPLYPVLEYEHVYGLLGTFARNTPIDMRRVRIEDGQPVDGVWEGGFQLGVTGTEQFQISRDGDLNQLIYPAQGEAMRTQVLVRGPDEFGGAKRWLVRGPVGDVITVRLQIVDARISVTVSSKVKGAKVWKNALGWERHNYSVAGSWNDWTPVNMVMDPEEPGIFRGFFRMGTTFSETYGCFTEFFQVNVEEDRSFAWYPMMDGATCGDLITLGPDRGGQERNWVIKSLVPCARFEVILDLNTLDRRKIVTTKWLTDPTDMDASWGRA
uniref:Type I polyketide synthase n=1 Tax=Gambierdiscus polynesiensis TaxID=439318 RepID=A0A1S6K7Y1_9DINO|nr:type I polyketide synthase [Gambierdiscus polynesiensis]